MSNPVEHLVLWRAIVAYPMPPLEKAVLTCLCSYGNSDGTNVFPSQSTLATLNDMSVREMRRIIQRIKANKFIVADGWSHRCKKWRINTELFLAGPPKVEKPVKKEKKPPVVPAPVVETPVKLTFAEQIRREMSNHV